MPSDKRGGRAAQKFTILCLLPRWFEVQTVDDVGNTVQNEKHGDATMLHQNEISKSEIEKNNWMHSAQCTVHNYSLVCHEGRVPWVLGP